MTHFPSFTGNIVFRLLLLHYFLSLFSEFGIAHMFVPISSENLFFGFTCVAMPWIFSLEANAPFQFLLFLPLELLTLLQARKSCIWPVRDSPPSRSGFFDPFFKKPYSPFFSVDLCLTFWRLFRPFLMIIFQDRAFVRPSPSYHYPRPPLFMFTGNCQFLPLMETVCPFAHAERFARSPTLSFLVFYQPILTSRLFFSLFFFRAPVGPRTVSPPEPATSLVSRLHCAIAVFFPMCS